MQYMILGAHQKDLTFALSSWETLDLFDYERDKSTYLFSHNNETQVIKLGQRGMYKFEFFSQLLADTEEMIFLKFRLNIDGTPHDLEFQLNTGTDQKWDQIVTLDIPDPDVPAEIIIEVNATPNDGAPTISSSGNEYLLITKIR